MKTRSAVLANVARLLLLQPAFTLAATFYSQLSLCPDLCHNVGSNPANWTVLQHVDQLKSCDKPVLFDLSLANDLSNTKVPTLIRACVTTGDGGPSVATTRSADSGCGNSSTVSFPLQIGRSGVVAADNGLLSIESLKPLLVDLDSELLSPGDCGTRVLFSASPSAATVIGVYIGSGLDTPLSFQSVVDQTNKDIAEGGLGTTFLAQACPDAGRAETLGLIVNTEGDVGLVQSTLRQWNNGTCVDGLDIIRESGEIQVGRRTTASQAPPSRHFNTTLADKQSRNTCSTTQVVSGDGCGSLAARCGISGATFESYNPLPALCSTLQIGQHVCCSPGDLPDFRPQPNPDGTCATYTVQAGEWCALIASDHFITADDIENFNKQTWGWNGCQFMQLGQAICLSTGSPPMPAPVSNAICGPQVLGTQPPSDFSKLANLNPCPLNSCCNIWGQCGITPSFCTIHQSETGAPGTSPPGTTSCISNCGTNFANNDNHPAQFLKVGYWESWAATRGCLGMTAAQIPSGYSHIHYAFGGITNDYQVDVSDTQTQFNDFKATTGFKKILSFGGWSFS